MAVMWFSSGSYPLSPMMILNLLIISQSVFSNVFLNSFESWISSKSTLNATIICHLSLTIIVILTYFFFTLKSLYLRLIYSLKSLYLRLIFFIMWVEKE
uniref:Uncharacterized protein n=1 Tax=Sulfolobus neozealandicus TaxID=299422 RepID=Q5DVF7_9CREN|nr:hypothetical protein [Sulfolobus neozealandicus]